MKNLFLLFFCSLFFISCKVSLNTIFNKRTPHEKYEDKLKDTGLIDSPAGRQWMEASQKALHDPQHIQLPFNLTGYVRNDKPRSLGLEFKAKAGEQITFNIAPKTTQGLALYADLFKQNGDELDHLMAAGVATTESRFTIEEAGIYILRIQPELNNIGEYTVAVTSGPSLGFPVAGNKGKIGSIWGDDRDGGKRSHEGIDIFAPKLTPVVAAADGYVTSVREGGLGGKTVWMRPTGRSISLYYAHLDKQLVEEGQRVNAGDTLGLVGNTGNAKYTPSHLHFGIYTYGGAIDPLPFVNNKSGKGAAVPSKDITGTLKLTRNQKIGNNASAKANTLLLPLAVTAKGYIAELPDGNIIEAPFASVKMIRPTGLAAEVL